MTTYYCHRSGTGRSRSTGKRLPRSNGSNKTGFFCPAIITVQETQEQIKIWYQKTHHGHDNNSGRLTVAREDRFAISEKIRSGIPFDVILDDIRNNAKDLSSPLNLIDNKDLHNIKRGIGLFNGRYDSNDFVSVHNLVEMLKKKPNNPIRYYKTPVSQAEADNKGTSLMLILATDFQLEMLLKWGPDGTIFLDSTHGTNSYKYQLTSIVVLDEFGNGLPTAFCLSADVSANEWETFFVTIKEELSKKTGHETVIKAKTIMTDNDSSFYNAWSKIMGHTPYRLLCAWHIDQAWRRNLGKVCTFFSFFQRNYFKKGFRFSSYLI